MRYMAYAADYDGTLASGGLVNELTLDALKDVRDSGRKLQIESPEERVRPPPAAWRASLA
jgi:hydroxymethylpyrimidine pyrophosphatase-like HAD family hydrolase